MKNVIPTMTHPLSKYWDQPDKSDILIDDNNALMTHKTMKKLYNYSTSVPTGVYEGKMWRSEYGPKVWLNVGIFRRSK